MWEIYDELLAKIPEDLTVLDSLRTKRRIFIKSQAGYGTAMCFNENMALDVKQYLGRPIKEVAGLVKSWEFDEASVGLAAINSFFNQESQILSQQASIVGNYDVFADYQEPGNLKIATIGDFHYVDRYPKLKKVLTIFELKKKQGVYPTSATEFLLPEMDVVFITGSTLVNKTLPRLLTLSEKAETILVGGSVPLSSSLLSHGVNQLAGKIIQTAPLQNEPCKTAGQSIILRKEVVS